MTGYTQRELLRRVGNLAQVGGVELVRHEEGHARGVRAIVFRTGSGFSFSVLPDRGLDVGMAEFQGVGLCWLPPKGLAGPWYYEGDLDSSAWLRVGLGGLFNTAGLVSIGVPLARGAVALVNRRLRGGLGVYLRWNRDQLPAYLAWRMMREGLYALGLEPATNPFGNPRELADQGYPIMLAPGEKRTYELEFGMLVGTDEIDAFAEEVTR